MENPPLQLFITDHPKMMIVNRYAEIQFLCAISPKWIEKKKYCRLTFVREESRLKRRTAAKDNAKDRATKFFGRRTGDDGY